MLLGVFSRVQSVAVRKVTLDLDKHSITRQTDLATRGGADLLTPCGNPASASSLNVLRVVCGPHSADDEAPKRVRSVQRFLTVAIRSRLRPSQTSSKVNRAAAPRSHLSISVRCFAPLWSIRRRRRARQPAGAVRAARTHWEGGDRTIGRELLLTTAEIRYFVPHNDLIFPLSRGRACSRDCEPPW